MTPDLPWTARVRADECDPYGHLNNAVYVHYLMDAARADGRTGAPAALQIEYAASAGPGDRVDVEPTAGGTDGASYRLAVDGVTVATATISWGPAPIPDPDVPARAFTIERPVEWRDLDRDGHLSPGAIASLAEDAGIQVTAAHRWPMSRCTAAGFGIVLRSHRIVFGGPVTIEDTIRIATWVRDPRRSMATRRYVLTRDGDLVADLSSLYVWVDLDSGRPIRIPEEFLADFAPNFLP